MDSIGRLARKFGLSRSTLLYYDSIGLLRPSSRTKGNYRLYSEQDARRLEQIRVYRRTGLSLEEIGRVLDSPDHDLASALERRLEELDEDIKSLRRQQHVIIGLLRNNDLFARLGVMNKETWVSLLAASGFSEKDMLQWHLEFERLAPEKHQSFLEFLGLSENEIRVIRSLSAGRDG
ncbi:MAG: MerR family transcriptional regulator [Thermodesulfobacteriota bacterium]